MDLPCELAALDELAVYIPEAKVVALPPGGGSTGWFKSAAASTEQLAWASQAQDADAHAGLPALTLALTLIAVASCTSTHGSRSEVSALIPLDWISSRNLRYWVMEHLRTRMT